MHVVHRGFDTIALSIQANISQELFELLNVERERAEEKRHPVPFSYGGADFDLLPHGGNGYRFILKGGPLDITWFFKKPNVRDPWGIRVSVGSTLLATQGLGYARSYIDKTLTRLGVRFESHQVSIGRVDFCVDILAPDFELIPEHFVIHSHTNRADYLSTQDDVRSNGKSGQFTSVTVGKMPGRQVIIYDKRREVIDKKKPIWWDIWNANLERDELAPLDHSKASQSRVWRVEVRAGKDLLKDRWQIRTWPQFDAMFGDVISEALQKIRYCEPDPDDSNRARWPNHEIWDLVAGSSEDDLQEMRSHIDATNVKHVHRAEQIRLISAQIAGLGITLAALEDTRESELCDFMDSVGSKLAEDIRADPERAANKLHEAKNRYRFIA